MYLAWSPLITEAEKKVGKGEWCKSQGQFREAVGTKNRKMLLICKEAVL